MIDDKRPVPGGCLLTLLLLALPLAYWNVATFRQWSQARQLQTQGQDVEALVVQARTSRGTRGIVENFNVDYRLPPNLDPSGQVHAVQVDQETFRQAQRTQRIKVRILPDHPQIQQAVGGSPTPWMLLLCVAADLALLALLVIVLKGW